MATPSSTPPHDRAALGDGDIVTPDQMQTKIKIGLGSANIDVSLVTIGNDNYQTNPVTGQWGPAQPGFDYSPTVLFDKDKGSAPSS